MTARVLEADRVDVAKIQLSGVAHSRWLAEESNLLKLVSWKIFSEMFIAKFFPDTVKTEMEHKFINLRQAGKTVDAYVAEFFKLSRFSQYIVYMVSTEEN